MTRRYKEHYYCPEHLDKLLEIIAKHTGISVLVLHSPNRAMHVCDARHMYYFVAKELTGNSLSRIAQHVGRSDHTNTLNSMYVVPGRLFMAEKGVPIEVEFREKLNCVRREFLLYLHELYDGR